MLARLLSGPIWVFLAIALTIDLADVLGCVCTVDLPVALVFLLDAHPLSGLCPGVLVRSDLLLFGKLGAVAIC